MALIDVNVKVDLSEWQQQLNQHKEQIPYAFSLAINNTMKLAQAGVKEHATEVFHIRKPSYLKQSIKITQFAKKQEPVAIMAVAGPAGTTSVFEKFESGDDKTPHTGTNIAIPDKAVKPDVMSNIPKSKRPRNLKGAFIIHTADGKNLIAYHDKKNADRLVFAYQLLPLVKTPAILDFG